MNFEEKINKKIIITGGHVTPALAVIEEIEHRYPYWSIVFIGRRHAIEGSDTVSEEYRLIHERKITFLSLFTGRLQRSFTLYTIVSLLKIPFGILQALYFVLTIKPAVIISFGGYIALPVVLAGWFCGVRILTHEQTLNPGLANRIIAFFASTICVSYEEVRKYFPDTKTIVTGLPIRKSLFQTVKKSPFSFGLPLFPMLYITGGSTGAMSLNELIYPIVATLSRSFVIIHQVGRLSFERASLIKKSLPLKQQSRYVVTSYLDESEHAWALQHATLVIGRSGANTTGELASIGAVSILIPLPWSGGHEQTKNAQYVAQNGGALVLNQQDISSKELVITIHTLLSDYARYKNKAKNFSKHYNRDGATRIVDALVTIL